MNKLSLIASALAVLGLTACEKTFVDDIEDVANGQVTNSLLQVRTRAGGAGSDDATVAYPVTVYVFSGDECKAAQTIGDEGQTLNIALTEGTYSVFAVGGASSTDYVLPSASDALTTSAITLREGKSHGDLMAAKATVTLADGEANTVTLGMERRTMLLQSVVMKKIPTAATAVSVSVSPLWKSLTVGGNYAGVDGSYSLSLEKQSDGRTWMLPSLSGSEEGLVLLPPSSSPASITVRITTPSGTRSYTYSTSNELEAGYKINIEGTYTEAVGVSLTGTIEGATWLGERTIRFDFNESGSSTTDPSDPTQPNDPTNPTSDFPAAGDTYQGCYVLASVVASDGESAELTLLSPNEKKSTGAYNENMTLTQLESLASDLGTDGISGWRPMTRSEALLLQAAHIALGISDDHYYLFVDNETVMQMLMSNGTSGNPSSGTAYIRPVVTVTINNE
ncbi:MAG: FimB/Mfa2 family fimbrial subunit [Bacteroidales bacterium]|nr:FimB/Mfa2 family fimbrial subunit [Bacteroidales bacterium]